MPGQHVLKKRQRPLFQSFGEKGVVGVSAGAPCDVPGLLPLHEVLVHEQPHELRHGNGGMGVVELHRPRAGEGIQQISGKKMDADHVFQRTGDEEVLLGESEFLSLIGLVVGVEDLGDRL